MKMLRSIKAKIIGAQIGLLFFISIFLGGGTYFVAINFLKKTQQRSIEHIVEDNAYKLNQIIMDKSMALEMLASGEAIAAYRLKYNELSLIEYLNNFTIAFPVLVYANERGMEELKLVNGNKSEMLVDIRRTELFEDAMRKPNKVVFSYSPVHPAFSVPHMEFAICRRNFGEFEGVIIGRISISDLLQDLRKFKFEKTGFLTLLDTRGTILSHPQTDKILQQVRVNGRHSEEIIDHARCMQSGFGRAMIEGCDGYVAYAPVLGTWALMAIFPYQDFMSAPKTLRNIFAGAFLAALIAGSFIALRLSASITKPIIKLADAAGMIAKGDFSQHMDTSQKDEIGVLAVSFNKMVVDFQQMIISRDREITERRQAEEKLITYKENLEQMVVERTRELEAAQRELVNKALEAGRAQLSAMVLHNIGNAMTPVGVYVEGMKSDELARITAYLEKCYKDLCDHKGDLLRYVTDDARGKEVFSFMGTLFDSLKTHTGQTAHAVNKIDKSVSYISDILTLQQSYAARETEMKERADLNRIIEDAVKMQEGSLEKRGVCVEKSLEAHLPKLCIDKSRLVQVLVNLIKNSYESFDQLADQNQEKRIMFKSFHEGGRIGFEINDNGPGIATDEIASIGELGNSHKGSSGFGLYYSKAFIEANNGTLTVSSPGKGKGATVKITFTLGSQKGYEHD
jgi:signal transduction histidine kinase